MSRVSIKGVAELAGVSTMTVSRVLRGEGDSRYYDQVMAAVRELDYVPVRSAKQNQHIKTNSIGVLLDGEFVLESLVGLYTFTGMANAAFASGYDLLMLQPKHHRSLEEQKIQVLDRRCDGFVFVVTYERPEVLEILVKNEFPAVTCYSTDVPPGVFSIVPDNGSAIRRAVELLHQQGHRRIAFWHACEGHSDARERRVAYEVTARELGLESHVFGTENWTPTDGVELDFLLRRRITAVICHNDERALALWDAACEVGLRVPRDLSIIGLDNINEAAQRGLTTFTNPFQAIGEAAVATVQAALDGNPPREYCQRMAMPFIERASVAPPPKDLDSR